MKQIMMIVCGTLLLAGCATKQYPQASNITGEETSSFDCKAIVQEIAKVKSIQAEIEQTGEFDGKTVIGVLADFGIGNGMAKDEARKKAENRLNQLESLKTAKCQQG